MVEGTVATVFTEREYLVCLLSRLVENGKSYWVAGGGGPLHAILLAKMRHAPGATYVTEDGAVAPEPALPFDPIGGMVSSRAGYRALEWGTMNTVGDYGQLGHIDYGIINTLHVDPYGNINSTWLGDYPDEGQRFGGPGGADSIAALCWRTILATDHERRRFVPRVDFISSPGFLDGSPGAREAAGLPRDTGPWRVVTPWAMFDYEEDSHYLRLIAVSPFANVEQVLSEMGFQPLIADEIEVLDPPTEEELTILRTKLDVEGQFTSPKRMVQVRDDGTYAFVEV
ncbi:MAG: CoA-transferase [Dehalococcoidia bacterium]